MALYITPLPEGPSDEQIAAMDAEQLERLRAWALIVCNTTVLRAVEKRLGPMPPLESGWFEKYLTERTTP